MQRTQIKTDYCLHCSKRTKFERHVTAMGCGDLFMVIVTMGLWLVLRGMTTPKYRCTVCGGA